MQEPSILSAFRYRLVSTICVVLFISISLPVFAEWHKDYEAGMELIKRGENSGAIPKLQSAIRQKNDEGANIKFYGMKFGDYFPHYYLGMAYYSQKNYDAALKELEFSESQGAIHKKQDLYQKLTGIKTLAKAQLVVHETPQIAQNPNPPIQIPIVKPPEEKKTEVTPNVQPQEKKPPDELPVTQPQEKKPEEKVASVLRESKTTVPTINPAELDPNSDVRKTMLRNGARKYFEGDYDSAILYLAEVQKLSPADTPVDFLLGCSYASKYLLTGSQNKQFLDRASLLFRRVKKLAPKYQPRNKTYLSPAVLEIYEKTT